MDNKDLNENLTPDELVERLKEKLALDIDTYSKIMDNDNSVNSSSEDNDDTNVYNLDEVDEVDSSNEEAIESIVELFDEADESSDEADDFDDEFISVFENTAETDIPKTLQMVNDDGVTELHELLENASQIYETDKEQEGTGGYEEAAEDIEDVSTAEADSYEEDVTSSNVQEKTEAQYESPVSFDEVDTGNENGDDYVRQKLAQLFADFEDMDSITLDSVSQDPSVDSTYKAVLSEDLSDTITVSVPKIDEEPAAETDQIEESITDNSARKPIVYRFRNHLSACCLKEDLGIRISVLSEYSKLRNRP